MAATGQRAKRQKKIVGSGLDFADYRTYTPGDDVKGLDWRVYSRTERLFLKLYEEEEDLHIYFLVDASASMHLGSPNKWNYARQVAAALAYIGLSNLDRVSIIPFSSRVQGRLPPGRGKAQIFKIFDFLDSVEPGQQTSLRDAFKTFVSQNKRRGLAVVISDFYDPAGIEEGLNALRYHRFEPMVIQLFDQRELDLAFHGEVQIVDCESAETRDITVTPALLAAYRQVFEAFCAELEGYCKSRQILYFRAPIQQSFDELILRVFRAGGFLK
ncbi:DUF58 domain-containing protein [Lujinxingia litoralis]|uniref:DUF58 domain-containing protein n=2 Tax=Lujinxingia litoralis TaxID=2211119 RepID=A0A328C4B2_9DELT|nr:DUF58 domain-containing protein [Lujinxingia litoralis]